MSNCADVARRSPDNQLREVAIILATGFLRLRQRLDATAEGSEGKEPAPMPRGRYPQAPPEPPRDNHIPRIAC